MSTSTPDTPSSAKANHRCLTFQQRRRLCDWIELPENRQRVPLASDADLAAIASRDLHFNITVSNFQGMRRECGIEKAKPSVLSLESLQAQLTATDGAVNALAGTIEEVRQQLARLVEDLAKDKTPPAAPSEKATLF